MNTERPETEALTCFLKVWADNLHFDKYIKVTGSTNKVHNKNNCVVDKCEIEMGPICSVLHLCKPSIRSPITVEYRTWIINVCNI